MCEGRVLCMVLPNFSFVKYSGKSANRESTSEGLQVPSNPPKTWGTTCTCDPEDCRYLLIPHRWCCIGQARSWLETYLSHPGIWWCDRSHRLQYTLAIKHESHCQVSCCHVRSINGTIWNLDMAPPSVDTLHIHDWVKGSPSKGECHSLCESCQTFRVESEISSQVLSECSPNYSFSIIASRMTSGFLYFKAIILHDQTGCAPSSL